MIAGRLQLRIALEQPLRELVSITQRINQDGSGQAAKRGVQRIDKNETVLGKQAFEQPLESDAESYSGWTWA